MADVPNRLRRSTARLRGSSISLAATVALLGVLIASVVGWLLHGLEQRSVDALMDRRANAAQVAARAEIQRYTDALRTVAAGFGTHRELHARDFDQVTRPLDDLRLRGATSIVYVQPAAPDEVDETQRYWRRHGAPNITLQPAAGSAEHLFTVLRRQLDVAPWRALGLDLSQAPEPAEALRRARSTGSLAVSKPYELLRDRQSPTGTGTGQLSVILAAPVTAPTATADRAPTDRGWLLIGVRAADFLRTTMVQAAEDRLRVELRATGAFGEMKVAEVAGTARNSELTRRVALPVADGQWSLLVGSNTEALMGTGRFLDVGVAVTGGTFSVLSAALIYVLATARGRARAQVCEATKELRDAESEARRQAGLLSAVMDSIGDGVVVLDEQGGYLLHNPAALALVGLQESAVPGTDFTADAPRRTLMLRPDGEPYPLEELPITRALHGEHVDDAEMIVHSSRKVDGVWLNVTARPLDPAAGQSGAVAIFHDVTERRQAAERLRESEERLRLLLEGARDYAIFMLDPAGQVASWSTNAERLLGYAEHEIIGRGEWTFFTPDDITAGVPEQLLQEATVTGHAESDGWRVRKDGTKFWAHGVASVLHHADGSVRGYVTVIKDNTLRRQAEHKFRDLLEAAPDAILGVNSDGHIKMVNSRVEQVFGYRRDELIDRPVEMLVPARFRHLHTAHRESYAAHPSVRRMGTAGMELSGVRKDGSEFPADISLSTLETEDGTIISVAVRDITERHDARQAIEDLNADLRRLNTRLEERVAERTALLEQRTAQLEENTEQLRQLNNELEAFSYSVSHDLRAPLRAVDGFAKMLALDYTAALDDEGRRYLRKIRDGAQRMGRLIDGLLEFSRLQRRVMTHRDIDMNAMVAEVWDELVSDRAGRDVELRATTLPTAYGDPGLLRHVMANLLGNAVKYTRDRRHARIEVSAEHDEELHRVVYRVRDNGTGFDMRYADKLFQVFQRLHRAEEFEGTGIGLALAARVVHRHGGEIWAEAAPDRGATFFFALPDRDVAQARTEPAADPINV